jgi:hypothetical protein
MTLRSPTSAVLWELWRVTRVEAAWKMAFSLVVPLAAFIVSAVFASSASAEWYTDIRDSLASVGRHFLYLPHIVGWWSLAALSGGRFGFPLYLHYSRPIRTTVMVGLPMAYFAFMTFAMYLVSAFLLRATAGYPHALVAAAGWIAALVLVLTALGWSTRGMLVLMMGVIAVLFAGGRAIGFRLDSFPIGADYPLTDYALMALIALACFGVTVASVARQRRGDVSAITRTPGIALWWWIIDLFRVPCPTSSAIWAQAWLVLKSNGVPALAIGVVFAIVILLVSAVSGPIDAAINARPDFSCQIEDCFIVRAMPPLLLAPLSLFAVFFFGRNVFGIHRKQGRTYVSAFDATQAYGTARLAAVRLLATSACVLAALITIAVSLWLSMPLLGDAVFVQIWGVPLSSRRPVVAQAFAALTGYEQLALAIVVAVGVVMGVAAFAVFGALRLRYSRRVSIASVVLLLLYGLAFVWLAVGVRVDPDTTSRLYLDVVYGAIRWIATAAMAVTTIYVFWRGFAERVLTIRYASGAVAIAAAFGAAWVTALQLAGAQFAGMSAMNTISAVSPALLPLMASGLAPWSYSRIRHT